MGDPRVWIRKRKLTNGKTTYDLRWLCIETGGWKSRKIGTDKRRAIREAATLEQSLYDGTYRPERTMTWERFTQEHVERLDRRPSTVQDVKRTLEWFGTVCGLESPRGVSYGHVERFVLHLKGKGNGTATVNKRLRYVKAALNRAMKRGYVKRNVMADWEWAKVEQRVPRTLTDDEKGKLLKACPSDQWTAFVLTALTTGCRRGELLGLTWARVDFDNARIIVTQTKGHRDRIQPLSDELVGILRALQASTLKDGGPFRSMNENTICAHFRAIVDAAGIESCTIHDLRKTFCTDLLRAGVNQLVVQNLAGHASPATTARYYCWVDDSTKRNAVAKLGVLTA